MSKSESLILYRPLISNKVTQQWGVNRACQYPNGKIVAKSGSTCPAGSYDFYKSMGMKGHSGVDYAAWSGEPIFHAAIWDGYMKIEKDWAGGIGVDVISLKEIEFDEIRNGIKYRYKGHVKCRYWHLKAPVGYDGKVVKLGDTIGLADNTGASSGDHLHFGVKKCDKDGNALEPNNGYVGTFNHEPYMNNSIDAKTAAEQLNIPPLPLSEQEKKEIYSQLSAAQRLLNALLELKRKM